MNPDTYSAAAQLQEQHRKLLQELKEWQSPENTVPRFGQAPVVPVPADLWAAFRRSMVDLITAKLAENRQRFEAL